MKKKPNSDKSLSNPITLFSPITKLLIGFGIVALAFLYLVFLAFSSSTINYLTINEAIDLPNQVENKTIGISGKLVESSYYKDPDGLTAYFSLTDQNGTSELPVIYKGEIGQIFFNEHSEIILQGKKQSNGIFLAETLTVKCPSKYLVEEELYDDSKL
ncbi:cytochrome c maturation protein CcmE [Dehalococcoidia bacterium]|nr:cytochrome c maturation protein CcmE [Dehalococcoidia bacterium]